MIGRIEMRRGSIWCWVFVVGLLTGCQLFSSGSDDSEDDQEEKPTTALEEARASIGEEVSAPELAEVPQIDGESADDLFDEFVELKFVATGPSLLPEPKSVFSTGIEELERDEWLAVFHSPGLAEVDVLAVSGDAVDAELVAELARSEYVAQLEILELVRTSMGDEGVAALADAEMTNLRGLALQSNSISDAGIQALAGASGMPNLKTLKLADNDIGVDGATILAHGDIFDTIRWLGVGNNPMGGDGVVAIADSPKVAGLRGLDVEMLTLDDRDLARLAEKSTLHELERLVLSENELTDAGLKTIADSPLIDGLDTLIIDGPFFPPRGDFRPNEIGDEGITALVESESVSELGELAVEFNDIGHRGAAAIANSPHLDQLEILRLRGNSIGDRGGAALAESDGLASLLFLDLAANGIGGEGMMALADSRLYDDLHFVHLGDNVPANEEVVNALWEDNRNTEFIVNHAEVYQQQTHEDLTAPTYDEHIKYPGWLHKYRHEEYHPDREFGPKHRREGDGDATIGDGGIGGSGVGGRADLPTVEEAGPTVVPGQSEVEGPLDEEIVRRVVRQTRRDVENCFAEESELEGGTFTLTWTIAQKGDVEDVAMVDSTFDDADIEECLTGRIHRWSFPAPDGDVVEVQFSWEY